LFVPGRDDHETVTDDTAPKVPATTTTTTATSDNAMVIDDDDTTATVRDESIQVVCQYLSNAWRDCFLNHLQLSRQDVLEGKSATTTRSKKIKPTADWNAGLLDSTTSASSSSSVIVTPKETTATKSTMTAGAKRLQKVNTKGMSKLSSFFAAKPKQT
jgi:hypothetical protein